MKRLTVIYEVPDDIDVTRITGTGELNVVRCEWMDALERLAAAEAERDAARLGWDGEIQIAVGFKRERDECRRLLREACDYIATASFNDAMITRWAERAAKAAGGEE